MITCLIFPTTFIIKGPPAFTAWKLATFSKKAKNPWRTNKARTLKEAEGSQFVKKSRSFINAIMSNSKIPKKEFYLTIVKQKQYNFKKLKRRN